MKPLFLCAAFILVLSSAEWYESQVMVIESWAYVQDYYDSWNAFQEYDYENPYENAALETKTLALEMLSGLVYGYEFDYVPPSKHREIEEKWKFNAIANITGDDPNLSELERNAHNDTLRIFYRYNLLEDQVRWLQSWEESEKVLHSKGEGLSFKTEQKDARIDALHDAIQSAIRNRIKRQLPAITNSVSGKVKIAAQPFFIDKGNYFTAKAAVLIIVDNTEFYKVY